MTESKKIDLKAHFDEVKMASSIHGNKIAIHDSRIDNLEKRMENLEARKDSSAKVSETLTQYATTNQANTVKIVERLDSTAALTDERFKVQSGLIQEMNDRLDRYDHQRKAEIAELRNALIF